MAALLTNTPTASMTQSLVDDVYARMFGDKHQHFDLFAGTATSQGGTKIIYLSTDIIVGMYRAIEYEAGDAWKVIFNSCGQRWGKRVATSFDKELRVAMNRRVDSLMLDEYVLMVEKYFSLHGWGRLRLSLDGIENHGVLYAELFDSIFRYALPQVEGVVDQMIGGMLCGMFETMAQTPLDYLAANADSRDGVALTQFLLTGPDRISWGQSLIDTGEPFAQVLKEVQSA